MPTSIKRPKLPKLLVNRGFQLKVVKYSVMMAFIIMIILGQAGLYFLDQFESLGKAIDLPSEHPYFLFMNDQKSQLGLIFLSIGATSIALIVAFGIILSHKVAGPLYRLEKSLKSLAEGKSTGPIKFREKDFFHEMASAYNDVLEEANKHGMTPAYQKNNIVELDKKRSGPKKAA